MVKIIVSPQEFLWDEANTNKNWLKHKVTNEESEEVFGDEKKIIYKDLLHSDKEERFIILGMTKNKRLLYLVFTYRRNKIRVISVRDTNKKEREIYEKTT